MSRTRVFLLAVLAVVAAVWAWTVASPERSAAVRAARAAQAARPTPPVFDLQVRAERLDGAAVASPEPRRNPFRFGEDPRAPQEPQPAGPLTPAAIVAAPPALPALVLVGIVDRTVSGKAIRVAVVSSPEGLVYAQIGERVSQRYEVTSLSADAVELKDLTDGSTRRLAMK
jgi:hypothetical protein